MTRVFLGLGSNIDPHHHIRCGLNELQTHFEVRQISPIYQSPARGFKGEDFLNLVVELEFQGELLELFAALREVEFRCGRSLDAQKYTPRTLDIDILLFGEQVGVWQHGVLPRADVRKYAYVLKPLLDICPDICDPANGQPLKLLWPAMQGQALTLTHVR